jgi:hypothetical protein
MGQKINILIPALACLFLSFTSSAQDENFLRPGLIRSYLTITPSAMLGTPLNHIYLHGNLEYYINEKYSFSGDSYVYAGQQRPDVQRFDYVHSSFFGMNRHFTKGNHDFYIGFYPGFGVSRLSSANINLPVERNEEISPLLGFGAGYNFYFYKFFHFFAHNRIVLGSNLQDEPVSLNETRFSVGLGFNLNLIRK